MISQEQLVGLTKQVFILEYLINGLFPCQSDVVRLIRSKKREWKFNNKFEYRMLLAVTNSGGSLNSQVFRENVGLNQPGSLDYGLYQATYGTVADGFDVDMMLNLETKEKQAAFENDYATRMHSLRTNVAGLFKNFAIHGQYGVVFQLRSAADGGVAPTVSPALNPVAAVGYTPQPGVPFTIRVPINVFQTNFKRGRFLIKTTDTTPWGAANVAELYMILDNQPGFLVLLSVGTAISAWAEGQFLEIQGNREIVGASATNAPFRTGWTGSVSVTTVDGVSTSQDSPYKGTYPAFQGTGAYSSYTQGGGNNNTAVVGAMEGLADLFPWYTDPTATDKSARIGLYLPYRGQPNRLQYATEQAGGWIYQQPGEHIIDVIMRGSFLTKATVPYAEIGVWMNPVTRIEMGYEEGPGVRVLRDNFVQGPIVWQRGTKTTDYQIGSQVVREVIEDLNMPTDVIIIGPKDDMSYNCWDNATFQIDQYIQQLWAKTPPKRVEDIAIPDELMTKMDLGQRIIFGTPAMNDAVNLGSLWANSSWTDNSSFNIRHPKNTLPVALQEMGALFTEYPYTYTVCKLQKPIFDITTV
jgi:hypothetical protein